MKNFIKWLAKLNSYDVWYFNYASWGLVSFIFFAKGRVVISIIYLVMSVLAYLLATIIRKVILNENNKPRYF